MQSAAPFRDASVPIDQRVEDLLGRMTLEEKVGLMFHPPTFIEADGSTVTGTGESIVEQHLNHFNIYAAPPPRQHAEWHNRLQEIAASTRLGIPVTISSDPRHTVGESSGASGSSAGLSEWPEPIGFAAVGDVAAVEEFGDIARLGTEPSASTSRCIRWQTSPPSRGGRGSCTRSVRTASSRQSFLPRTSAASRDESSARTRSPA